MHLYASVRRRRLTENRSQLRAAKGARTVHEKGKKKNHMKTQLPNLHEEGRALGGGEEPHRRVDSWAGWPPGSGTDEPGAPPGGGGEGTSAAGGARAAAGARLRAQPAGSLVVQRRRRDSGGVLGFGLGGGGGGGGGRPWSHPRWGSFGRGHTPTWAIWSVRGAGGSGRRSALNAAGCFSGRRGASKSGGC